MRRGKREQRRCDVAGGEVRGRKLRRAEISGGELR